MATKLRQLLALAGHEWRRCRFSPVLLIGVVCAAILALSETGCSDALGYPSGNQALYGFQLGTSVVLGFIGFLLSSGSLAADLEPSRNALIFSRPISPVLLLAGKFIGVTTLTLLCAVPVMILSICCPVFHGTWRAHSPGPFLLVFALCTVPMSTYVCTLALALTAVLRKVIVAFPLFLLYFFTAALLSSGGAHGQVNFLDFSQRLYPRELVVHMPLLLRDCTFSDLLDPISPDLLARTGLYLALAAGLLLVAWMALRLLAINARWAFAVPHLLRRFHRNRRAEISAQRAAESNPVPQSGKARTPQGAGRQGTASPTSPLADELLLLWYSAKMLAGRNLLATALVILGLFLLITSYRVGPLQTREGVLFMQLEMFSPLLGIVMFSDLVAGDFVARRSEVLRVCGRGPAWLVRRKLAHAIVFSVLSSLVLIVALRLAYCGFSVLQALFVGIPGMLLFGSVALLVATAARKPLVGYAAGCAAMMLGVTFRSLDPLTAISFQLRQKLANDRLLGEWNWVLAKVIYCGLALALILLVLKVVVRPSWCKRAIVAAAALLAGVHIALHLAWTASGREQMEARSQELEVRTVPGGRVCRKAVTTPRSRGKQVLESAALMDSRFCERGGAWVLEGESPVDLTKEAQIPHVELEATVDPRTAQLSGRASFTMKVLADSTDRLRFFLGTELGINRLTLDGRATEFTRLADLIEVKASRQLPAGGQVELGIEYGGRLVLPQNLRFEGVSRDLLFATTRWYPSLRGMSGVKPLFTCKATIRAPKPYWAAACTRVESRDVENVFVWESGGKVDSVPLCVGRFNHQEMAYRDAITISLCTLHRSPPYAKRILEVARQSLTQYEAEFGPYPYRQLAIVENPYQGAGGTGFPSLVGMKPERLAPEHEQRFADIYVPHEIAHMWFGNAVPPWVAEGAAAYANCRFLASTKGRAAAIELLDRDFYPAITSPEISEGPLVSSDDVLKYTKGAYLFQMLEYTCGQDAVLGATRTFLGSAHKADRVDADALSDEFIRCLKASAGEPLEQFIEDWTRRVKRFDPAIVSVMPQKSGGGAILLRHFGEIRFPVPLQATFADGTMREMLWEPSEEATRLLVNGTSPLASAEIDPGHLLLDWNRANNKRSATESADAALSAAPEMKGWRTFTKADGLPDLDVRSLAISPWGAVHAAVWSLQAAMNGRWAVASLQGDQWALFDPKTSPVHLINAVAAGTDGSIWLASQGQLKRVLGDGSLEFMLGEIRTGGVVGAGRYRPGPAASSAIPGSRIYCLAAGDSGRMWVGTDRGLAALDPAGATNCVGSQVQALAGREVFAVGRDSTGRLWAGTDKGLFVGCRGEWKAHTSCPGDLVLAVAAGPGGAVWCGTYRSGLVKVSESTTTIYSCANSALRETIISAVVCDGRGSVWAATPEGLVRFDGRTWTTFTRVNSGLPSNRIYCLLADKSGGVWIGTDVGVTRYEVN